MIVVQNSAPAPNPDIALVKAIDVWAKTVTSKTTTAGKAKTAYLLWKAAKGYK
jgi:hypothetical protein